MTTALPTYEDFMAERMRLWLSLRERTVASPKSQAEMAREALSLLPETGEPLFKEMRARAATWPEGDSAHDSEGVDRPNQWEPTHAQAAIILSRLATEVIKHEYPEYKHPHFVGSSKGET